MQACHGSQQISGLVPLRKLVQPGCWCWTTVAAAAAQLCRQPQPARMCQAHAASTYAQASPQASSDAVGLPSKPLFSSRAKIAETCVPWLKVAKNRWVQVVVCVALVVELVVCL